MKSLPIINNDLYMNKSIFEFEFEFENLSPLPLFYGNLPLAFSQ